MQKWNQLHLQLETIAKRHLQLAAKFQNFAKFMEMQVSAQTFHIKGIVVSLHVERGYFNTTFAGRTLCFTFSSSLIENGSLMGTVACYLVTDLPEKSMVPIGHFTFDSSGNTNLINPENGDQITMEEDFSALHLGLHFIYESLSK